MIKPLGERVVVRREKEETKTSTGIILGETNKEKSRIATVVALGTGRILDNGKTVPFNVKVGDRVFLSSYAGDNEVTYEDDDLTIVDQSQILAVIE
jgi:chaperonin GroES